MTTRPVLLDTDIGTDVDDVLALAMLLGSPEVALVGCTTVHGDTELRARLAARLLRLAGREDVPVVAGAAETLSGSLVRWGGWEGRAQTGLATESIETGTSAVEFLCERARKHAGQLVVAAVGPLTNVAAALRHDADFARNVGRLVVMGGRFDRPVPEHNFATDPEAVRVVFASGVPVTVTGLETTTKLRLTTDLLPAPDGTGLSRLIRTEAEHYWAARGVDGSCPHDPIALLPVLCPELFTSAVGRVKVEADGPAAGAVRLRPDHDGARVMATDVPDEALREIVRRITAATRQGNALMDGGPRDGG